MKQCCECKENINLEASRCRHCTAIQGWRRLVRAPIIIAGLVLTIVSIVASEPIKKFFDQKNASIQAVVTDGDFYKTNITLTNEGTRAATLQNIKIEGMTNQGHLASYYLTSDLDGKLIEPGKSYVTTATSNHLVPRFIERMRSMPLKEMYGFKENCRLLIDYIDVNGEEIIRPYPFMCDPLDSEPRGGIATRVKPEGIPIKTE